MGRKDQVAYLLVGIWWLSVRVDVHALLLLVVDVLTLPRVNDQSLFGRCNTILIISSACRINGLPSNFWGGRRNPVHADKLWRCIKRFEKSCSEQVCNLFDDQVIIVYESPSASNDAIIQSYESSIFNISSASAKYPSIIRLQILLWKISSVFASKRMQSSDRLPCIRIIGVMMKRRK